MTPEQALDELMQVSLQVRRAIVLGEDGQILAEAGTSGGSLSDGAGLLDAADEAARLLGRPPITQLEVGLGDGAVFAVRDDAGRAAVAVAEPDATAGLVFYDLRQVLRALAGEDS